MEGLILTEKGRKALEEKEVSEAIERLLSEIADHPSEVSWSPIPAMGALQEKALRLELVRWK